MDKMRFVGFMEANFFALLVLIIIYFNARKYSYRHAFEQKLYTYLIFSNIFMLVIDIMRMYINGKENTYMFEFNFITNFIMFALTPLVAMLWSIYIDYKVFMDRRKIKRVFKYMSIFFILNLIILILGILGILKGKAFYIDSNNVYHRGELHKIPIIISYCYIIYSIIIIRLNKNIIDDGDYKSLRLFCIPPFIGGILQSLISGLKLVWISMALSMFIIFLYVQNNLLHVDVLTGLYNRRNLEKYLKNIFSQTNKPKTIAGILIDINDFKYINDTFGHDEGDRALVSIAKILKDSFKKDDFISRYAGDEFIIISEVKDYDELIEKIKKLKDTIDEFNKSSSNKYKISMSKGYEIFKNDSNITLEEFINTIDTLMYEDKERYKKQKLTRKDSLVLN